MRHIHFHPLGGAAGDMVVACLLDAFPEHRDVAVAAAQAVAGVPCRLLAHADGVLTGSRFEVDAALHHHHHTHWSEIRAMLGRADLPEPARAHAIAIFAGLADAEARVHGLTSEEVTFHEVGAKDSIADIVAAATLIAALEPAGWSVAPLPIGGGTVRTAHGLLPVPAPATALLLEGFAMADDGIAGERVTPTGAAILRHLRCTASPGFGVSGSGVLQRSGHGFGSRRLPGISNCLRALVFETDDAPAAISHRELAVISFEVDDQSGEDLALGLERVRAAPGVHDVVQMAAFGKKSRLAMHVQVLTRPDALEDVVASCFQETTTIGLRTHLVQGRALPRRFAETAVEGNAVTVKLVERPSGITGKAEADHLRSVASHAARTRVRRAAERQAEGGSDDAT